MKRNLKQSNLVSLILVSLIIKGFFEPYTLSDSLVVGALSLLFGFKLYLDHIEKPDYFAEFNAKLEDLESQRDKQLEQMAELYEQRVQVVENKISTLNMTATKPKDRQNFGW